MSEGQGGLMDVAVPHATLKLIREMQASKDKEKVTWKAHTTELPMGLVDINKIYGNLKGAIVYAYTAVDSPAEQPVDLRPSKGRGACRLRQSRAAAPGWPGRCAILRATRPSISCSTAM